MAHDAPTALNLPMVDPLPEVTQKYFDVCQQKLGMVPNVLRAYAFDIDKLNAFTAARDDCGRRVVREQMLLLSDGPWRGCAATVGQPDPWRTDGDELARR